MLPGNHIDRIRVSFDDHLLMAKAGLLPAATLAQHLGLRQQTRRILTRGDALRPPRQTVTSNTIRVSKSIEAVSSVPRSRSAACAYPRFWKAAPAIPAPTSFARSLVRGLYLRHRFPKGNPIRR